jgi:hypothetical protein
MIIWKETDAIESRHYPASGISGIIEENNETP